MRTFSTPQSALNGEITKLAIVECVASVALYVGLGVYFGTFKYLAVAIVFAPLMLFRTTFSAEWGLKVYEKIVRALFDDEFWRGLPDLVGIFTAFTLTAVAGFIIRPVSTVYGLIRRPIQTLRNTPQNWLRQSLCTDFAHPPEIVPLECSKKDVEIPRFGDAVDDLAYLPEQFRKASFIGKLELLLIGAAWATLFVLGWLPSLIYRISFKATALAYTPFVWVAHATLLNPLPVKARLERFTRGELEKVRRGVSYFVLLTLVAKGALVFNWVDRTKVESMFPSQKVVTNFVVLDAWPWWQITFGADAVLTFALLFFADAALSRVEAQRPWREEFVTTAVTAVSFLRASFGLVTMAHFFHTALVAAAPEWARHLLTF